MAITSLLILRSPIISLIILGSILSTLVNTVNNLDLSTSNSSKICKQFEYLIFIPSIPFNKLIKSKIKSETSDSSKSI